MNEYHLVSIYELTNSTLKVLKSKFKYHKKEDGSFDYDKIAKEIDIRVNARLKAQELIAEYYLDEFDIYPVFSGYKRKHKIESAERFLCSVFSLEDKFISDRDFIKITKVIEFINLKYKGN